MTTRRLLRPLVAALVIAAVGGFAGYLIPLRLAPIGNLGFMLGVVITGPLGLIVGLAFGIVANRRAWNRGRFLALLSLTATLFAALTLFVLTSTPLLAKFDLPQWDYRNLLTTDEPARVLVFQVTTPDASPLWLIRTTFAVPRDRIDYGKMPHGS